MADETRRVKLFYVQRNPITEELGVLLENVLHMLLVNTELLELHDYNCK